jgi:transcriptional regulator with XRE-family HTH domain
MKSRVRVKHEPGPEPIDQVFTEIRVAMARRDWNQRDLANAIGVSEHWVSRRFTRQSDLSVDDLFRIADAFNMPAAELLGGVDRPTHKQPSRHAVALSVRSGPRRTKRLCPAPPLAA